MLLNHLNPDCFLRAIGISLPMWPSFSPKVNSKLGNRCKRRLAETGPSTTATASFLSIVVAPSPCSRQSLFFFAIVPAGRSTIALGTRLYYARRKDPIQTAEAQPC